MKVILKEDVKSLGKKNEVVNVSDGYAQNFLMPRGLAVPATEGGIKDVKEKNAAQAEKKARLEAEAKALAEKISKVSVKMQVKCGANGKLFGAITSKEIADELKKQYNFDIDKKQLVIKENIKSAGTYKVTAKVLPGIAGEFNVVVEGIQ